MEEAYPYLREKRPFVETLVLEEEKLFLKTLSQGEKRLKQLIKDSKDNFISGEEAFKLYDTYGFPYELTEEYLDEFTICIEYIRAEYIINTMTLNIEKKKIGIKYSFGISKLPIIVPYLLETILYIVTGKDKH